MRTARRTTVIVLGLVALGLLVWGLGALWSSTGSGVAGGHPGRLPGGGGGFPDGPPPEGFRPDGGPGRERHMEGIGVGGGELVKVALPLLIGAAIWFVGRFLLRLRTRTA